jgi:hypothetical protein
LTTDQGNNTKGFKKLKKGYKSELSLISSPVSTIQSLGRIASLEQLKAFLDLVYFASRGRTSLDLDEIDTAKLSRSKLREFSKNFPEYTKRYLYRILKNRKD